MRRRCEWSEMCLACECECVFCFFVVVRTQEALEIRLLCGEGKGVVEKRLTK